MMLLVNRNVRGLHSHYNGVFLLTKGGLENRFVFSELSFTFVIPCWEREKNLYIRAVHSGHQCGAGFLFGKIILKEEMKCRSMTLP